mgnify:CR=1 FL=1
MREQAHRIGTKSSSHRRIGTKRNGCIYRVGEDTTISYEPDLKKLGVDRDDAMRSLTAPAGVSHSFPSDQSV